MEIVIDIPDQKYKWIIENPQTYTDELHDAIRNGTPLPKGHGRIADIDKVLQEMDATRTYDIPFALERVKPIIEADRKE